MEEVDGVGAWTMDEIFLDGKDLYWRLLIRGRSRFDVLRLGGLVLLLPTTSAWEVPQVHSRRNVLSFFTCGRTSLGFNSLVHNLLAFILLHRRHS